MAKREPIVALAEPSSSDLIPTNVENAPRSRDLAEIKLQVSVNGNM
jgi:hypothetical protein